MKKLWDLKKVFSNLELEGQGRCIIRGVTGLLLLGPFYTIQTKRDQTFWRGVYLKAPLKCRKFKGAEFGSVLVHTIWYWWIVAIKKESFCLSNVLLCTYEELLKMSHGPAYNLHDYTLHWRINTGLSRSTLADCMSG